jgi:hypothetical protein
MRAACEAVDLARFSNGKTPVADTLGDPGLCIGTALADR